MTPNLTQTPQAYSDLDFVRLLRHGVRPNGTAVPPGMPSASFSYLEDADLGAIIAYIRSLPAQGDSLPTTRLGPADRMALAVGIQMAPESIDHAWPTTEPVDYDDAEAAGRYLAITACTECHGVDLRGETNFLTTPSLAVAAGYSREEFREFLRTGVALGGRELPMMSSVARGRFVLYTDREIDALHRYPTAFANGALETAP